MTSESRINRKERIGNDVVGSGRG